MKASKIENQFSTTETWFEKNGVNILPCISSRHMKIN